MRRHVTLYLPRKDGTRLIDVYESVAVQTGEFPESAEFPEVPEAGLDVWDWYFELRGAAGNGMNGPEPITYPAMSAWAAIYGRRILPVHDRLIRLLDAAYMGTVAELGKKAKAGK